MAKGKKTGGRDFKKGHKGGPGKPPVPPDLRAARDLTRLEFERTANKYLFMKKLDFQKAINDPEIPMFELMMANIVFKATTEGDERRLEFLCSRLIGKVVQPLSGPDGKALPVVHIHIPSNGREAKEQPVIEAQSRHVRDDKDA